MIRPGDYMFKVQRIFTLLLCLVALAGAAFADGTHDPIIDLEGGTGSNPYFGGAVSFTVNFDNSACSSPVAGDPTVSCGTTSNFLRPGADGSGVFSNDTGTDITSIHVSIETFFGPDGTGDMANVDQGTFSEFPAEGGLFPGPIIPDPNGNGATFTGGDVTGCPVIFFAPAAPCTPGEFLIGYAEVLVPVNGSAVVEFDANPVPEPGSLVLTAGMLPAIWLMTKKKLARR